MKKYVDVTKIIHMSNAHWEYSHWKSIFQNVMTGELFPYRKWMDNMFLSEEEEKYIESEKYYDESRGWACHEIIK